MCGEKRQELGRPWWFLGDQVGYPAREGEGMPKTARGSDSPIVLRDGRADHEWIKDSRGEGASRDPQPVKETRTGHAESEKDRANLTAGNSPEGSQRAEVPVS
jgi:hypothetical protein